MAENGRRKGDAELVLALAGGQTVRAAARLAGVGEHTATRRVTDPAFRRRVAALRAEMVARAAGHLADGMAEAAATVRWLLAAESEAVRLAAARTILEVGPKLREATELEDRLAAIEAQVSAGGEG
jgi:hypothetical protein